MQKERPLWERLYFDEAYVEIARLVGYRGTTYREMAKSLEPLERRFGKQRVQSATYYLVTFEGQMTCNPSPLAEVKLRPEVRKLCWQLLGPPPESEDAFNRHADGTRRQPEPAPPRQKTQPTKERTAETSEPRPKRTRKKKPEPSTPTEEQTKEPGPGDDAVSEISPIIDQYRAAKEKHPHMMVLFRTGDRFKLFDQDAEIAHELLGLTLTTGGQPIQASFPHHQLETQLNKLLKAGRRVAICDPIDDAVAKRPAQREAQRIRMHDSSTSRVRRESSKAHQATGQLALRTQNT